MWAAVARVFWGLLLTILGDVVFKVLAALGIGLVTYTGVSATMGAFKNSAVTAFLALPQDVVAMLSLMKVGTCISMVVSAIGMRLVFNGMNSDTVKRWVKK